MVNDGTKRVGGLIMTREEAKALIPIIKAYAEGKMIQKKWRKNEWMDVDNPTFFDSSKFYRIKPQPTYRPFKDREECWQEMQKHQPFGWTHDTFNIRDCITRVTNSGIVYDEDMMSFEDVFNKVKFADGTPFGIKVEE